MKHPHVLRILFFSALCTLLLSTGLVVAQDENLLVNPGFDGSFREVSPDRTVAANWQPWNVPLSNNSPSYEQVPTYQEAVPDTDRIRTGSNAQQISTNFYFTYSAGIYQQVSGITSGTELRFSIYAWIWSSALDDREISENPGDLLVYVGIDPTGGTSGTSDDIVWSPAAPGQYDAYRQYAVIAEAESDTVTVFVWAEADFPTRNNFVYLDDAVLEITPDSQPQPTDEPVATNTPAPTEDIGIIQPTDEPTPTREGATDTPAPTATLLPTFTPVVVNTDEPVATSTSIPTNTPEPEIPTDTPQPTFTPVVIASATPEPSVTPVPTNTPAPEETEEVGVGGPVDPDFPGTIIHTVRSGDTVSRLAVLYNSTVERIIAANDLNEDGLIFVGQGLVIPVRIIAATEVPTNTPIVVIVTPTPVPDFGTGGPTTYIVQPGDTLSRIAARFNTSVAELAVNNGILNPNLIRVGQQLVVPATGSGGENPQQPAPTPVPPPQPQTYTVQPGDNLYRISLRFGVTMLDLANANGILNANRIFVGQRLVIP